MSHLISLSIILTSDLGIKSIVFNHNDTKLESDSVLLRNIAIAILKAIAINKDDVEIQDLLNSANITFSKK